MTPPAPSRGHGKVILVGEHAAVYGHPALAGALDRGVALIATARPGPLALRVPGWSIDVGADDDHPVARALVAVAGALGLERGFGLDGVSDLAARAGLGSSAALAVAITRALAVATGRQLDDDAVAAIADHAERCFHGNPSGVDVAIATRGGFGLFRRGAGLTPLAAAPLTVVIGLSGQPRSTAAMVERVAAARAAHPTSVDAELAALGASAETAAQLLGADAPRDHAQLGAIFAEAHQRLARLGVSAPVLDQLVAAATAAGAAGAKLTGGGGGGAVIALAPGREDAVLAGWRALGKDGFIATVGGTP